MTPRVSEVQEWESTFQKRMSGWHYSPQTTYEEIKVKSPCMAHLFATFINVVTLCELGAGSETSYPAKGPFTLYVSKSEIEKYQRTIRKDQSVGGKHQRKLLLSLSLSLGVNGPLVTIIVFKWLMIIWRKNNVFRDIKVSSHLTFVFEGLQTLTLCQWWYKCKSCLAILCLYICITMVLC